MSSYSRNWMACCLSAVAAIALSSGSGVAEEWGTIKGTFVFDGDPPKSAAITPTKDLEVCGAHKLVDESLVVNPSNKGIADVVIFLTLDRGEKAPAVHPSYKESESAVVRLDNRDCRFQPHVALVRTGQTLRIGNDDPVGHNTKVDTVRNPGINPIVPANSEYKQVFTKEERLPSRVSCSIHPWMSAWLVVKETPYFAATDADGKFEIRNVPVGKRSFQAWHGHGGGGYITNVSRYATGESSDPKNEKWSKGKFEIDVKPGDNDLGTIIVPAKQFKK